MADNKEITTLHPYMNRNKNRYPNVKEENIPDTIQRKLTAGQGIDISPENVISATGGDSYTRSETDALLDTKADKVALENVNKVVPTDIAVKDGKLGLEHDTTWLRNQNAITLGDGLTYDESTKTLKASGGDKLPTGSSSDPFNLNMNQINIYGTTSGASILHINNERSDPFNIRILTRSTDERLLSLRAFNPSKNKEVYLTMYRSESYSTLYHYLTPPNDNKYQYHILEIAKDTIDSLADGDYSLSIKVANKKFYCVATQGGGGSGLPTYNHYIVISDGTASNAIYLLIPSTNSLICSSLPELNNLLGTTNRFIQASGVVTDAASKLPIVAINWQGSFSSSKIVTMSSEEVTTKFTDISDMVEPA